MLPSLKSGLTQAKGPIAFLCVYEACSSVPATAPKGDGMKKLWSIYTMEYYSAIRRNDYPKFAATWMALVEIMLSEISQAEKDNYHIVSLIYGN